MMNLQKYRRFIIVTFLVIVISAILTLAAVWNSILSSEDIRNEGWIFVFFFLLIAGSVVLFYFSYNLSDSVAFEDTVNSLVTAEKEKLIKKMEERKMKEKETLLEDEDFKNRIDQVFAGLQSVKSIESFANKVLMNISRQVEIVRGVFFFKEDKKDLFKCMGEYALTGKKPEPFKTGENLTGQVAKSKTLTSIEEIPEDYFRVESGLGVTLPKHLIIFPLVFENKTLAVIELATFKKIDAVQFKILNALISDLGERLNKFVTAKK
ncbi:MAG: GAF domain-containing protein [Bacteroidales bacterium]|nr:GAF domain-containing protein [Bacteroidales bacterium]